jgi:hypothetical protein
MAADDRSVAARGREHRELAHRIAEGGVPEHAVFESPGRHLTQCALSGVRRASLESTPPMHLTFRSSPPCVAQGLEPRLVFRRTPMVRATRPILPLLPLAAMLFIIGVATLSRFSAGVRPVVAVGLSGSGFSIGVGFAILLFGMVGRIRS